jgi:rubrerythrin
VALEEQSPSVKGEALVRFRCLACGYGASRPMAPERCPMCSGSVWAYEDSRLGSAHLRPSLSDESTRS